MPYPAACYPHRKMALLTPAGQGVPCTPRQEGEPPYYPQAGMGGWGGRRGGFLLALQQTQPMGSQYGLLPLLNFLITFLSRCPFYETLLC